jgi:hypothetical protein
LIGCLPLLWPEKTGANETILPELTPICIVRPRQTAPKPKIINLKSIACPQTDHDPSRRENFPVLAQFLT